jgi:hypothetical protein
VPRETSWENFEPGEKAPEKPNDPDLAAGIAGVGVEGFAVIRRTP